MMSIVRRTQERRTKMRRRRREGRRVAPSVRATGKTLSCKSIMFNMHCIMMCNVQEGRQEELKPIGSLLLKYCGLHHHHLQ